MHGTTGKTQRYTSVLATLLCMLCILATYAFGNYLFAALLPNMQVSIGFDYSAAGLITSMGMVAFLAGSLISARLCAVIGPENLVILTMLVTAGALFGYSLAGDYWTLLILRTMIGVATATAWVPMAVLVPRFTPPSFRGRAMGFVNAGTNFGLILNGLLLSFLLMPIGSGGLWVVTGLISLSIGVGCMIVFRRAGGFPSATVVMSSGGDPRRRIEAGGSRSGMVLVLVCASIVAMLGAPLLTYLSAYAVDDLGYRPSQIAPIWSMMGIAGALGGVVLGWIADKRTIRTAIVMAFALLGATAAILTIGSDSTSLPALYVAAVMLSIGFFAVYGLLPVYISQSFPAAQSIAIFGYVNAAQATFSALGNYLFGFLRDQTGSFDILFWTSVGLALVGIVIAARGFDDADDRRTDTNRGNL